MSSSPPPSLASRRPLAARGRPRVGRPRRCSCSRRCWSRSTTPCSASRCPSISEALKPSATGMLWIVDVYPLVLAGLLVAMGSLGDRIGRRRLLLIGATGFAAVSAVAAFAPTAELLIGARAALGVFGAMLMPVDAVAAAQRLRRPRAAPPRDRDLGVRVRGRLGAGPDRRRPAARALLVGLGVPAGCARPHPAAGARAAAGARVPRPVPGPGGCAGHRAVAADDGADRLRHQVARGRRLLGARRVAIAIGVGIAARSSCGVSCAGPIPMLDMRLFTRPAFSGAIVVNLLSVISLVGFLFFVSQHLQLVIGLTPAPVGPRAAAGPRDDDRRGTGRRSGGPPACGRAW